jgi:5-deoxy-D-glucuronate isomerase
MLFKDKQIYDELVSVFEYQGYSLYSYKSRSKFRKKLDLKTNGKERLVFSLKGSILVNGMWLGEKDMAYVPVGTGIEIGSEGEAVIFVAETDGATAYNQYVKKYTEAERLHVGQPTFRRSVIVTIGEKDRANRFIAGYVEDSLGEWSSYPPHKHDDKPEAYIFYGIDPGFAIQIVLDGTEEKAFVVHDYDTVLIPRGYHPHVNTSLKGSNYAWIISAPPQNRNLSVDIHPAFKDVNLGKSHLSIKPE